MGVGGQVFQQVTEADVEYLLVDRDQAARVVVFQGQIGVGPEVEVVNAAERYDVTSTHSSRRMP